MRYLIVIPARYQSTRLPGKPLVDICGIPMVIRTYQQCLKAAPSENVVIATDDQRIIDVCQNYGANAIMTSDACMTGTDRVAEVALKIDADVFINVQGDEPLFNPEDIKGLIRTAEQNPESVINGYCEIASEEMFRSSSTPKVVFRPDGRLLYMSRAAIPTTKSLSFEYSHRQVCAYAFPRKALSAFAACSKKTPLEAVEDIEILRFLELGWEVKMIPMSADSIAVDNPEDVVKAVNAVRSLGSQ